MRRPMLLVASTLLALLFSSLTYGRARGVGVPATVVAVRRIGVVGASAMYPPAPSATPTITPTTTPVPTPTSSPTPTASPTPPYSEAGGSAEIEGITHVWQTWNNCGPATLSMYLGYYGTSVNQEQIAAAIHPEPDDKNVRADELVSYAQSRGYRAVARVNGTTDLLKLLLSNGIPVIVETWYEPEPDNAMGHYRLLTGYDDDAAEWIAYDSYDMFDLRDGEEYAGIAIPYEDLDALWPVMNRGYVVVYPDERAATVAAILGADMDEDVAWQRAIATAEAEVATDPGNPYAWFNLGSDLVAVGLYEEAASAYQEAEAIGWPTEMLRYQYGIFEAAVRTGRTDWAIDLANSVFAETEDIEEVWYWYAQALATQGESEAAIAAYERAIAVNPGYAAAATALAALIGE